MHVRVPPGTIVAMVATTPAVTFLFTDIEGSTRLWETEPARMADALARHDRLCHATVEAHGGRIVKMTGDGLYAVFDDPVNAVAATLELQRGMAAIGSECGVTFKMRCGLHVGVSEVRDGDYFGSAVNRAARIAGAAHGGQVLLSQAVVELGKGRFPDGTDAMHLGRVRLRDLSGSEDVWQLLHSDLPRMFPALRSLDSTPNNLPQQLTSFIGRENEIVEVKKLLGTTRLLTLTGSGGCGKTRLATHVAADLLDAYPDGVWLVELASLADPDLVPQTVIRVVGLKEEPGRSLAQTLSEHLKSRHLLLVLDNAEHLLSACAQLADAVLRQCPRIVILVTSREVLGMAGELTYRVPSLSVPDPKRDATPEHLSQYESVRLFIERARFQLPQFAVTQQNAPALVSVCYRLDGIPLALELAAARVRSMSVEEVNQRLDQRFLLLTSGSRTALPRQQTLRALIDWSYGLLNDAEKALLCRLSVFAGGWTLAAAENVCVGESVDDGATLDLLTSLVDKSLVLAVERNGATRYRLLETVRQYLSDRLRESGEDARRKERHLAYFLTLAEEAELQLIGSHQQTWLDRLETEHDNVRSALAWSNTSGGNAANGLQLAGFVWWFWLVRGYFGEGRGWLSALLTTVPSGEALVARAKALTGAGALALQQGDYPAARALHGESLAIRRQLGDRRGIASSLGNLGNVFYDQGDYPTARALYEESLAIWRELGDQRGIARALNNLAGAAHDQGDYPAVLAMFEESLAIFRKLDDLGGIAMLLNNLGDLASSQSDYAGARALYIEGLTIRSELGDRWGIAETLNGLAYVAFGLASFGQATRMWGGAERLREEIGATLQPRDRLRYDRQVAAARAAMGDNAFDLTWQDGRAMTLEQAIRFALGKV